MGYYDKHLKGLYAVFIGGVTASMFAQLSLTIGLFGLFVAFCGIVYIIFLKIQWELGKEARAEKIKEDLNELLQSMRQRAIEDFKIYSEQDK